MFHLIFLWPIPNIPWFSVHLTIMRLVAVAVAVSSPLIPLSLLQVDLVSGQEDEGHGGCVPGFQVKHYQVAYIGPFQKGQPVIQGQ